MWNNVINAWWPLVFYPATDAPRFKKGMIAMLAVAAATLVVTWLVWYLERREKRIVALKSPAVEAETRSANGSIEGTMVIIGERDLDGKGEQDVATRRRGSSERGGEDLGLREKEDREAAKDMEKVNADADA